MMSVRSLVVPLCSYKQTHHLRARFEGANTNTFIFLHSSSVTRAHMFAQQRKDEDSNPHKRKHEQIKTMTDDEKKKRYVG